MSIIGRHNNLSSKLKQPTKLMRKENIIWIATKSNTNNNNNNNKITSVRGDDQWSNLKSQQIICQ